MNQTLLIVDDNEDVRQQLKWGLSPETYDIVFAADADQAIERFRAHKPQVVTLDLGLPPKTEDASQGFACLDKLRHLDPAVKVIVITGFESREYAQRAIEAGAYDFFLKPIDLGELTVMIRRAFHLREIELAGSHAVCPPSGGSDKTGLIGQSPAMRDVISRISRIAASDVPVLIQGESGTGKELVAQAIHNLSPRAAEPMVCINCGAIPEHLIESEFFGHERGAFTGAVSTVRGKVEYANNGSLFLDEIGELPAQLQVKLLRFLQEMVFQRIGGRKNIEVNIRVIAATNADIQEALRVGTFREDLYYRIGVVSLKLPPLRARDQDVVLLAEHFLLKHGETLARRPKGFTSQALASLQRYPWPGNVRELENTIRRAMVMCNGEWIAPADLGFDGEVTELPESARDDPSTAIPSLKEARNELEKSLLETALNQSGGNIVKAAEALGISRPSFYDLLRKHGITP